MRWLIFFVLITFALGVDDALFWDKNSTLKENYISLKKLESTKDFTQFGNSGSRFYFLLGRVAFELGEFEESKRAFLKILELDSHSLRAKLELARCELMLENFKQAKELFLEVKDSNPPQSVENNIDKYLTFLEKLNKRSDFSALFLAAIKFDSNIDNTTDIKTYSLPAFPELEIEEIERREDFSHIEFLGLNYSDKKLFRAQAKLYNEGYFKYKEKNLNFANLSLTPYYKNRKTLFESELSYNYINRDKKSYLYSIDLKPKITHKLDNKNSISLFANSRWLKYYKIRDRDSTAFSGGFGYERVFSNRDSVDLELEYGDVFEKSSKRSDVGYRFLLTTLDYTKLLSSTLKTKFSAQYRDERYKKNDPLFLNKKSESSIKISNTTTKVINEHFALMLDISYLKNSSNQKPQEYEKSTILLSALYLF